MRATITAWLFFWCFFGAIHLSAASFEVEGELDKVVHRGPKDPNKLGRFRYGFSVAVDEARYFIKIVPRFDQTNQEEKYVEVAFDGEQQYKYWRSGRRSTKNEQGIDHVVDIARISNNRIPEADSEVTILPLWFAFASGEMFRSEIPSEFAPLWFVPVPAQLQGKVRFPIECELADQVWRLPRRALFRSEGKSYTYDPVAGLLVSRLPAPYHEGFPLAEYVVEEPLRLDGGLLPKRARYWQRGIVSSNGQPALVTLYEISLSVTNALPSAQRDVYVPRIITKAGIEDRRIQDKPIAASYTATNWPEVRDRMVQYQFRKAEEAERNLKTMLASQQSGRLNRLIFFGAVTATAIVVVALLLRREQHQHANKR
jgi:hypothetical protein